MFYNNLLFFSSILIYFCASIDTNTTQTLNRLYIDGVTFTEEDLISLHETLDANPLFLLRIRKYSDILVSNSVFLQKSSLDFFDKVCVVHNTMCSNGFLIDLLTDDKIIIIQPGTKTKKIVSDAYRMRVIETVKYNLLKQEWVISLGKAIRLLSYKSNNGLVKLTQFQNSEPETFQWKILVPTLIGMFIIITYFNYLLSNGYMNKGLFVFLDKMIVHYKNIQKSPEKRIELPPDTCLFCMESSSTTYMFLYCNHSYHHSCLYKWRLHLEKVCPCSYKPVEGEESSNIDFTRQVYLNTKDIKLILAYTLDAHRKQNVFDYFITNEHKIKKFNDKFNTSFEEMCWIYTNQLNFYKNYRFFIMMWRTMKMMCCILTFYPSNLINSKKGRLVRRLLTVRGSGATVGGFK